jgi:hypothetical protein
MQSVLSVTIAEASAQGARGIIWSLGAVLPVYDWLRCEVEGETFPFPRRSGACE